MDNLTQYFDYTSMYVTVEVVILALSLALAVNLLMTLSALRRTQQVTVSKPASTGNDNQHKLFDSLQEQLREIEQKIASNKTKLADLEQGLPRTAIHRYNPFRDSGVGGNQSFSLASIDRDGNGSIITHLFSREMSRVSAKQISEWSSEVELSPEEKQVLEQLKD